MPQIRRILFPIDFSEQTRATAPLVNAMASRFDAQVVLLNVVPMPSLASEPGSDDGAPIDVEPLKQDLEPRLDGLLRKEFAHLAVERVVELGDPAEIVARFADTQGVDLTMIPTRGHGPFRRLLLGSVAAKVIHDTQCPVWTSVHSDQPVLAENHVPHTLVCAVERTPDSSPVMEWAAQFAEQVGAKLKLVHVIPGLDETPVGLPEPLLAQMQKDALDSIESMKRRIGLRAPTSVVTGRIGVRLREEAQNHKASLLVIGRGRLHDSSGRFGKNAYDIVRHAPCPVINV